MEESFWRPTYICTDCGEEVKCGLVNAAQHSGECKRNAKNENIESYRSNKKLSDLQEKQSREFNKTWQKMSSEERNELALYGLAGTIEGNTILMGGEAMERYLNFKKSMTEKYSQ